MAVRFSGKYGRKRFHSSFHLFPSSGRDVYRWQYRAFHLQQYWEETTLGSNVIILGTSVAHCISPLILMVLFPRWFSKFLVTKPERNTWGFQVMWSVVSSLILFPPLLCAFGMRHVWMYEIYVPCATRIASQTASSTSRVGFIVLWGYAVILTDLGRGEIFHISDAWLLEIITSGDWNPCNNHNFVSISSFNWNSRWVNFCRVLWWIIFSYQL